MWGIRLIEREWPRAQEKELCTHFLFWIFLYKAGIESASKGKKPQTIAKRITPMLHMSAAEPTYFPPSIYVWSCE